MTPRISVITSLYRCQQYLKAYLEAAALIDHPEDVEILLLHNEPLPEELQIIESLQHSVKVSLRHIIVSEREGLYATWNRGLREVRGEFIAIWNVDDVRTPFSLDSQRACLEA